MPADCFGQTIAGTKEINGASRTYINMPVKCVQLLLTMYKKEYETMEFSAEKYSQSRFFAAVEESIELYVNNTRIASILASPEQLEQLAAGYLVCEGIVHDASDIIDIRIDDNNRIFTQITRNEHFELWFEIHSSGCIGVNWENNEDVRVDSDMRFCPDVIQQSLHHLESEIYQLTRGTHAACLIDRKGSCVTKAVDVGRHNAVDKAIGQGLLDGIEPSEHFLISTGRQPAGMILKAARAGIPLVVTKTAPLNSGIETAWHTGICLVGFATPQSFTIFTNHWRLYG
jgi:FdhD protein